MKYLSSYLFADNLSVIMISLLSYICLVTIGFSSRYLDGDSKQKFHYFYIICLYISLGILFCSDNIFIFLISYILSNFIFALLMLHKHDWIASKASFNLFFKNFLISFTLLFASLIILSSNTGYYSINLILNNLNLLSNIYIPAILLFISVMMQSAIFPFHKWLISSLNSPTPVSALMHAGFINGGGYILIRFSQLFNLSDNLLTIIFVIGIASSIIGTFYKLIQSDIKRMLACSTMAQMGFMIAQFGLGQYRAAFAHIILHGLFKSYLFFASASTYKDKIKFRDYSYKIIDYIFMFLSAICSTLSFWYIIGSYSYEYNTSVIFYVVIFISGFEIAKTILREVNILSTTLSLIASIIFGVIYGINIKIIDFFTKEFLSNKVIYINIIHVVVVIALILLWCFVSFIIRNQPSSRYFQKPLHRIYVYLLNSSQPNPKTVTSFRNHYKY